MKQDSEGTPVIRSLGPHVTTHARHFDQKSSYTICGNFEKQRWSFVPHECVFNDSIGNKNQDLLWKIKIPASERSKVLTQLDLFNLNRYSLFQTQEAMLGDLAFRIKEKLHRK